MVCPLMSSRPEESHPRALPDPCVNLSIHTAPDVQPLAHAASSFTSSTGSSCCQLASVGPWPRLNNACLLYTSDAADDLLCVDLGGRRIIKKKNKEQERKAGASTE